jgi:endonuclease/exonuclease/phosphatase family metal-dependent hydrolase
MTDAPLIGPVPPPDLHVMTYNIRRPVPHLRRGHPDRWANRSATLSATIAAERPSVLGVQEALPEQIAAVAAALGGHTVLGYGRSRGLGDERAALFVDEARLQIRSWDQLALSRTPQVAGSRSWGTSFPRVVVLARLRDRATGAEFTVANTHLDHVSGWARRRSARLVAQRVAGEPAIVLGDANAAVGSAPYRELTVGLEDAWLAAQEHLSEEWGTWANYRDPRPGRRIDWLLVSPDIEVRRIGMNAARGSDHLPVQAVLRVPA